MDLYHAINRGVDKRTLFIDERDYVRFVHDLYEFNDAAPADNTTHWNRNTDIRCPYVEHRKRKRLVDIHGWCLMKNHYHLLLSERVDGGLSLFLRKLNVGYARYFNERHGRSGVLFQGRTKRVPVTNHAHFLYVLHYVHLNPLDYLSGASAWRERDKNSIQSSREALEYLETYRWSSYSDYCGVPNFPSILRTNLFSDGGPEYRRELAAYLADAQSAEMGALALE